MKQQTLDVSGASRVQRPVGGSLKYVSVDPTRWVALVARTSTAMVALESATMGLIGGILGVSAGLLVVVGMAAGQTWTPVIDPVTTLLAPLPGGLVGLLTGLYPALRGARLEPLETLRSGTCA